MTMATHAYQDWPRPYRVLLLLTAATICAAGLLALGLLPGWNRHQQFARLVAAKEADADASRWPKDSQQLRRQLELARLELDGQDDEDNGVKGLRQLAAEAIDRAAITFRPRILASHVTAADFMAGVTRLDYKALYNEVEAELATDGLKLPAARLGFSDDENKTPVYQLIYRLWCVSRICQLARQAKLTIVANEDGEAALAALPPRAYVVEDTAEDPPYLLEFTTAATLRGTLEQFRAFCASLRSDTDFLPLTRLQICTSPPNPDAGKAMVDICDFTIACSAFFPAQ